MTGEPAERDENGKLILTEQTGLVLVLIPGGTFRMGLHQGEGRDPLDEGRADERSIQTKGPVTLSPYFLSKSEMTQGQWKRLTGVNPSAFGPDAEWKTKWLASRELSSLMHPVEQVSWYEVQKFLGRLNENAGNGEYRLPYEAEWEYAARAGSATRYWWGDEVGQGNANCDGCGSRWDLTETAPVSSFAANPFGLHDVHGNVWEWTADAFEPYPGFTPDPYRDYSAPWFSTHKVLRGGAWISRSRMLRNTWRNYYTPDRRDPWLGFRTCALTADQHR